MQIWCRGELSICCRSALLLFARFLDSALSGLAQLASGAAPLGLAFRLLAVVFCVAFSFVVSGVLCAVALCCVAVWRDVLVLRSNASSYVVSCCLVGYRCGASWCAVLRCSVMCRAVL